MQVHVRKDWIVHTLTTKPNEMVEIETFIRLLHEVW